MGGEECIIQVNDGEVMEGDGECSIMEVESDWLRQTDQQVHDLDQIRVQESKRWRDASIYRIPWNLKKLNSRVYQPHVVAIGPYHHGEAQLAAMEEHKHRALLNFLKRTDKPLKYYFDALAPEIEKLKGAYPHLQPEHKNPRSCKFLKMMVVDGCFILELMRHDPIKTVAPYVSNDPIFSEHGYLYWLPFLKRDMLMLENQIPLLVLIKLQRAAEDHRVPYETSKENLRNNILEFFDPPTRAIQKGESKSLKDGSMSEFLKEQLEKWGDFLHILDLYRKSLLLFPKKDGNNTTKSCCCAKWLTAEAKTRGIGDDGNRGAGTPAAEGRKNGFDEKHLNGMRSATKLTEAGIGFRKSKIGYLNDMKLGKGSLKLPQVTVDATSRYLYPNLMAFERLHVGDDGKPTNEVTSYVFFMDRLIDTADDVALLHWHGIIDSLLGCDDDVAKLFNRLSTDICPDSGEALYKLQKNVAIKYRKPGRRCLAYAKHNYFTNPWVTITILAGIFIFLLTLAQTVYAFLDYHKKK